MESEITVTIVKNIAKAIIALIEIFDDSNRDL